MSRVEQGLDTVALGLASLGEQQPAPIRIQVRIRYLAGEAGESLGRAQAEAVRAAMRSLGLTKGEEDG